MKQRITITLFLLAGVVAVSYVHFGDNNWRPLPAIFQDKKIKRQSEGELHTGIIDQSVEQNTPRMKSFDRPVNEIVPADWAAAAMPSLPPIMLTAASVPAAAPIPPPPSFLMPTVPDIAPAVPSPSSSLPKVDCSVIERAFHLKLTKQKMNKGELVLIFEFTKTVEDVSQVQATLQPQREPEAGDKEKIGRPLIYVFDEDNVVLFETKIAKFTGLITGRAGDAFRLHLPSMADIADVTIKKIEFRSEGDLPVVRVANPTDGRASVSGSLPTPLVNETNLLVPSDQKRQIEVGVAPPIPR